MKKCLKCGFRTEEEINFCPECGERLARVVIKKKETEPVVDEVAPTTVTEEVSKPEAVEKPETAASNLDKTRFNSKIKNAFFMEFIGNMVFLVLSVLIVFLKIFKSVEEIDFFGETLRFEEKFSIYDVLRDFFTALKNENIDVVDNIAKIYTVFFSVYFIMFAIFMLVKVIIGIYKMMDMDVYCLEKVTLLEKTGQINTKSRSRASANTLSLAISAFFMFLLIIIIDKIPYVGAHMYDGVTGLIAIVAILAVGGLVPVIISAVLFDQVKKQFLREKI